jgi:hypothetical protein
MHRRLCPGLGGGGRLLQQTCKTAGSELINKIIEMRVCVNGFCSKQLLNESYTSGREHSLQKGFARLRVDAVLLTFRRFTLGPAGAEASRSVLASDWGCGAVLPFLQLRHPPRERGSLCFSSSERPVGL